ncbi:LOG family protein [Kibdelosporangium philippinense]|uniref:LOG family protein n=1 Tax=Kibdelosporangium philippinense TaxID=211113 RepID=A0ABS8Z4A3_9PSEU|nr:LOG family protein [Kibdelosporangium philippinense]MCE7002227.1 LOG family protein [Kibdelosporangium philippinense]
MPLQVAVCGPRHCTEDDKSHAYEVGILLARAGAVVICGGGTGVMAAVAAGVRAGSGLVIGVRPNDTAADASPDLSAVIVTNLGEARNAIIVWSADAVIAIGGSWGTLSEIALAKRRGGIPVITLGSWTILDRDGNPLPESVAVASSPRQAVDLALAIRQARHQETI